MSQDVFKGKECRTNGICMNLQLFFEQTDQFQFDPNCSSVETLLSLLTDNRFKNKIVRNILLHVHGLL